MPQCLTYLMHNAQAIDSEWLWQLNRIISTCRLNFTVWNSIILRFFFCFFLLCLFSLPTVIVEQIMFRITIWMDAFNAPHSYVALRFASTWIGYESECIGHFYCKFNYNNPIGTWEIPHFYYCATIQTKQEKPQPNALKSHVSKSKLYVYVHINALSAWFCYQFPLTTQRLVSFLFVRFSSVVVHSFISIAISMWMMCTGSMTGFDFWSISFDCIHFFRTFVVAFSL